MIEAKIVRQGSLLSTTHLDEDELRALLVAAEYLYETERQAHDLHPDPLDSAIRKLKRAFDPPFHRRSAPLDYDPTPICVGCGKYWDETGNYKPEFRCPESPGALA